MGVAEKIGLGEGETVIERAGFVEMFVELGVIVTEGRAGTGMSGERNATLNIKTINKRPTAKVAIKTIKNIFRPDS